MTSRHYTAHVDSNGVQVCLEVTIPSGLVLIDDISTAIAQAVGKVALQAMPDEAKIGKEAIEILKESDD